MGPESTIPIHDLLILMAIVHLFAVWVLAGGPRRVRARRAARRRRG